LCIPCVLGTLDISFVDISCSSTGMSTYFFYPLLCTVYYYSLCIRFRSQV